MVLFDRSYHFLLVLHCDDASILHRFRNIITYLLKNLTGLVTMATSRPIGGE